MDNIHHLKKKLAHLILFLERLKEHHWCNLLRKVEYKLNGDLMEEVALQELFRLFGGMGSINDIYLSDKSLNAELQNLLSEIHEIARQEYRKIITSE